jgi:carbonic anhydrase
MAQQEERMSDQVNTGRAPFFCQDRTLHSPIDVQGEIAFKDFTVSEHFEYSLNTSISKISDHVFKMDGTFGYIGYQDVRYDIMFATFKSPSEHLIEGERVPLELHIVTKNLAGDHLTLSILFKVGQEPNIMMRILGFGKGVLAKLDNSNYVDPQKHRIQDLAVTLRPFLLNNGSWIMYEGTGLTPPCSASRWLISVDPITLTEEQLSDFAYDARPDFTIKTIGNRTIFRNKMRETDPDFKQLQRIQEIENVKMQEAMQKKKDQEAAQQKAKEEAVKQRQEALKKTVVDYRIKKEKADFYNPPKVGTEPMVTQELLKDLFNDVIKFNFMHTPCKNYLRYIPPLEQNYGYAPVDAVMVWEIKDFLDKNKNISIPDENLPSPVNKSYVFRPFYYVPKPDCHTKNASQVKQLARANVTTNETSTANKSMYVPVIIETTPAFQTPDTVPTTFEMAIPGKTPEIQNIVINRTFIPDLTNFTLQDMGLALKNRGNSGHIVQPIEVKPFYPVPELKSPVNSKGRVIRIWPEFNTTRDGILPLDAIYAWNGLKESMDLVLNVTAPKSFNPGYRWIVLMYIRSNYSFGDDDAVPLIPVYVLARNEFNYTKDKVPDYIPVPQNTEIVDGVVKAELITIGFTTALTSTLIADPSILEKPVGYEASDIFEKADKYRRKFYQRRATLDPEYFNATHQDYLKHLTIPLGGRPAMLYEKEMEQMTGMIILIDKPYRAKLETDLQKKEDQLLARLKKEADLKKRLQEPWKSPTLVKKYEKICVKWGLMVVVNDRIDFKGRDKATKDTLVCTDWEWRLTMGPNDGLLPTNHSNSSGNSNNSNSSSNSTDPKNNNTSGNSSSSSSDDVKNKILKEIEEYCLNKLHVILNDHNHEVKDEHYELCKSTLDKIRKTDTDVLMRSLGPALSALRTKAEISSEKIRKATASLKAAAKEAQKQVKDKFDKTKYMKPLNLTTETALAHSAQVHASYQSKKGPFASHHAPQSSRLLV